MNLELAVVQSCDEAGCLVKLANEESRTVKARFSDAVIHYGIRIRADQLVAVDVGPAPPEIVWRWYRVQVLEVRDHEVIIGVDGLCQAVTRVPFFTAVLQAGDEVWLCKTERGVELYDVVRNGYAAHPERFRQYFFPEVEAGYAAFRETGEVIVGKEAPRN